MAGTGPIQVRMADGTRTDAKPRPPAWRARLFATATALAACFATSGGPAAVAAQPRAVVFGGDADYPPFHYLDERGRPAGFDVEMARAVFDDAGIPLRIELGDWQATLRRLERGEVDLVPMFVSQERRRRFLFSRPYMLRYHAVYGREGTPPVPSIGALAGHTVAVQRAGLARDVLAALPAPGAHLVDVRFEPDAVRAVAEGRAEYALVPTWIGRDAVHMVALSPPLLEREYAFAISRGRPELVPVVDAALDRLRTSGRQQALFEASVRHVDPPSGWLRAAALLALAAVGAVAIVLALAARRTASRGTGGPRRRLPGGEASRLATELRQAIAQGTLGYALQPKLDLRTRRWAGAEVLVRWRHPEHGPLAPDAFLPLAERERVMGDMTLYLMRRAAEHCLAWRRWRPDLTLSVNISASDLADRGLLAALAEAAGSAAPGLLLEVTETQLMGDPGRIAATVAQLRQCGIRLSIDDFGTGHSSLTKLRLLEPDEVKIDRSFVQAVMHSGADRAIVRSTIQLAHAVGAQVTAEGIEDDATLEWLAGAGCDYAQGFGLAPPMPPQAFAGLLAAARGGCDGPGSGTTQA